MKTDFKECIINMINFSKAEKNLTYYRVIQNKYRDGRSFPINKIVIADKKVNLNASTPEEIGGFFISDYKQIKEIEEYYERRIIENGFNVYELESVKMIQKKLKKYKNILI